MKKVIITLAIGLTTLAAVPQESLAEDMSYLNKDTKQVQIEKHDDIQVDRSKRTNPYPSRPFSSMSSANEASRYRTDQAWSRGRNFGFWGSRRGSDIPTAGYSTTSTK